jgi:pyrophosphatase PpaX
MAYRTCLFDLDGTLIDTVELIQHSFRETARRYGLGAPANAEIVSVMGRPLEDCLGVLVGDSVPIADLVKTYREINRAIHDDMVRPYPGVPEAVETLHARGIALGIVTGKITVDARRGLRLAGIADAFDVVIGAHDVEKGKPHPEPVLTALARMGVGTEGALFVGDSTHDMEAGRRAGVSTAAALWGPVGRADLVPTRPSHWLDRIDELASLFE